MIFNPVLFAVGLSAGALTMSVTVLWYVARSPKPFQRGGVLAPRDYIADMQSRHAREINDFRIAIAEATSALEKVQPGRAASESAAVPYTLLYAQRLTIKMLVQVIERLTAATVEVRRENDPTEHPGGPPTPRAGRRAVAWRAGRVR